MIKTNNCNKETTINRLYDNNWLNSSDLVSQIILILYIPIGIVLLTLRLLLLLVLFVLMRISPNTLCNSQLFINLLTIAFGLTIKTKSKSPISNTNSNNDASVRNSSLLLIISNHVTPFDYLIIKSLINDHNLTFSINRNDTNVFSMHNNSCI